MCLHCLQSNVWTGLRRLMAASSQAGAGAGLYCAVASGLAGARHRGVETTGNGRGPEACLLCGLILGPQKTRKVHQTTRRERVVVHFHGV